MAPDDPDWDEKTEFDLAKDLLRVGRKVEGEQRLQMVVDKFPGTKSAAEAQKLLNN